MGKDDGRFVEQQGGVEFRARGLGETRPIRFDLGKGGRIIWEGESARRQSGGEPVKGTGRAARRR